ncbi:MAG: hypothetical protein DWQ18_05220 [Crenarchaeota archaeon]|mgnify:CR=1 FL=1|nr:MAG: hypothetical protein DWQ17_07910 [Thermoproteota archaeon]RDJ34286.1 MAG: hypothetical protein DWQ18_05220 [Thermoproteota archaeon]RDJ36602.1 MAG: hypothetical protein DWQ13_05390 [Thermoproteota archaeon]RDJ37870.1 MAG: hypothetical protein DWQ19_05445 [Thermoproteota archaeon]
MSLVTIDTVSAQEEKDPAKLFDEAKKHFAVGDYSAAVKIYDDILKIVPDNVSTLKMKGIALSNLEQHPNSLKQFYKALQKEPEDVISLLGMGIGFGNLGEYTESQKYFEKVLDIEPENRVAKNYYQFIDKTISKYPYVPTPKPLPPQKTTLIEIPFWVKQNAEWWSQKTISDEEFLSSIGYMVNNKIIKIPSTYNEENKTGSIPSWIKDNARWWSNGEISDTEFVSSIQFMIEKGFIVINSKPAAYEIQQRQEEEYNTFEKYLSTISKNISDEKRYIEYPNPSRDVIKKFLRDYVKWNFEQEAKSAADKFPDPTYQIINGTYIINYKIFVNEQPSGLPLDHVGTLSESLSFWETQDLKVNNQTAKIKFTYTNKKHEANIWTTWVVRDLGAGVLGHAHLGKGVVEVALGDYSCDGSFQLYDVQTVKMIMTHELGHSIGLKHTTDENNIMYPSLKPSYAYCILN